jgi:hypothetical protein
VDLYSKKIYFSKTGGVSMSKNRFDFLSDEINNLIHFYENHEELPSSFEINYQIFQKATAIKTKYADIIKDHPESFYLDYDHATSLSGMITEIIETDPYRLMKIIRESSMELADRNHGGFRDDDELIYKIHKEVISLCDSSLDRNVNKVIQPTDSVKIIEDKMIENYEINYFYSVLRLCKAAHLIELLLYFQGSHGMPKSIWFKEATIESFTSKKGYIHADDKDKASDDYRIYKVFYDTSIRFLKILKKMKEYRDIYRNVKNQLDY